MILNLEDLHKKYNMNVTGVIHIGAHFGKENIVYDRLNYKNRVFFEPCKNTFDTLSRNVKGWALHNVALGPKPGTAEMFVEKNNQGQSSSLLKPHLHLSQYPGITFTEKEVVTIETLDRMIDNKAMFNFINMDVQGYELEVLKGADDTLQGIDYLMCEVNNAELYKNCCMVEDIDKYLDNYKFKRVETDWMGNTWGDAFYVK
jgi:FkbM family methyltransferase